MDRPSCLSARVCCMKLYIMLDSGPEPKSHYLARVSHMRKQINILNNICPISHTLLLQCTGNNLTGVAVQFATQDRENAIQVSKCIAVFAMRNAIYSMPNSSKRRFSAMQNFESKLFPVNVACDLLDSQQHPSHWPTWA